MDNFEYTAPDSNIAGSPKNRTSPTFDHPSADVVLRSSDGVDFRVHKTILSLASPMFQTMFTLPIPEHEFSDPEGHSSMGFIPVIAMAEASTTLEMLLAFCYPMANPSLGSVDLPQLKALSIAVEKFEMDAFADIVDDALIAFAARARPVAIYAAGCQLRRPRVIRAAARRSLAEPFMACWSPELCAITGDQYFCLLDYHRKCSGAVVKLFQCDWSWIGSIANIPLAKTTQECNCIRLTTLLSPLEGAAVQLSQPNLRYPYMCYAPAWWLDYMQGAEMALKRTPCSAVLNSSTLYGTAMASAVICENARCRTEARDSLFKFVRLLARQVDIVISEIEGPGWPSVQT